MRTGVVGGNRLSDDGESLPPHSIVPLLCDQGVLHGQNMLNVTWTACQPSHSSHPPVISWCPDSGGYNGLVLVFCTQVVMNYRTFVNVKTSYDNHEPSCYFE